MAKRGLYVHYLAERSKPLHVYVSSFVQLLTATARERFKSTVHGSLWSRCLGPRLLNAFTRFTPHVQDHELCPLTSGRGAAVARTAETLTDVPPSPRTWGMGARQGGGDVPPQPHGVPTRCGVSRQGKPSSLRRRPRPDVAWRPRHRLTCRCGDNTRNLGSLRKPKGGTMSLDTCKGGR